MSHRSRPITTILLLLAATLLLSACGGLLKSDKPPRQVYLLQPWSGGGTQTTGEAPRYITVTMSAIPGLDTDRVLALSPDARLTPYTNARWTDHLPDVLSSVTRRTLEGTGAFTRVGDYPSGEEGEWFLSLEIRAFYGIQERDGMTTSTRTELSGYLACNGKESTLRLTASKSVSGSELSTIVRALQTGLDDMMRDLLQQLGQRCAP